MLKVLAVLIGFASGMVVSAAVFAFITVIGVVPRLAQKTKTEKYARVYEMSIALGGIFGTVAGIYKFNLPLGGVVLAFLSLCIGIFFGTLAMSLAEVLNVFPILTRRGRVRRGIFYLILAIALGKLVGALLYFLVSGFYEAGNI